MVFAMRAAVVFWIALALASTPAAAGSFRGGTVWWRAPDVAAAPTTIEFTITTIWDDPTTDPTIADLDFGDGTALTGISGAIIQSGTTALGAGFTVRQAIVSHTFAAPGTYSAAVTGCCRHATDNNPDATSSFRISSSVVVGFAGGPRMWLVDPVFETWPTWGVALRLVAVLDNGQSPTAVGFASDSGLPPPTLADANGTLQTLAANWSSSGLWAGWPVVPPIGHSYTVSFVVLDQHGATSTVEAIVEMSSHPLYPCISVLDTYRVTPGNRLSFNTYPAVSDIIALGVPATATFQSSNANTWAFDWIPSSSDLGSYRIMVFDAVSGSDRGECEVGIFVVDGMNQCVPGDGLCESGGGVCSESATGNFCQCTTLGLGWDGSSCVPICFGSGKPDCSGQFGPAPAWCCGHLDGTVSCSCPDGGSGSGSDAGTDEPPDHGGCNTSDSPTNGWLGGLAVALAVFTTRRPRKRT